MEGKPELPSPSAGSRFLKPNLNRAINVNPDSINLSRSFNATSTATSTSSSSSSSPPDLVRHVQAAFKRHRPIAMSQSNSIKPRRFLAAQQETLKAANPKPRPIANNSREDGLLSQRLKDSIPESKVISVTSDSHGQTCITPPEGNSFPCTIQEAQPRLEIMPSSNADAESNLEHANAIANVPKKVHFSCGNLAKSYVTEWGVGNREDTSDVEKNRNAQSMEVGGSIRPEGEISSVIVRKTQDVQNQLHEIVDISQKDLGNFMTQSSVVGSSCVTSTLVNSTTAPMISSTTYSLQHHILGNHSSWEPHGEVERKLKYDDGVSTIKSAVTSQSICSFASMPSENIQLSDPTKELQNSQPLQNNTCNDLPQEENHIAKGNLTDSKSLPPPSKVASQVELKVEHSKSDKLETTGKAHSTSRKKGYDPELFFKVNGKLYQRLGKIGSGGSSEVHKVISSDCTIYALKKIKLKGRDYATAYGFCQEIEYLNRLKGKNNIIRLIDYEVTDKSLLHEVMNGSMSNAKDGRVKDDGYIYMVLEYGEIDLAHMLSQIWKELEGSNATIDENWLRFYWQQILLAVNTIHEERIVHSDLKPANFLLVKGSLKLIDFGIAKSIMSDTTNIQRDSQVGTLSYMSPEAFMCNETDANGNTIKCGRPSDIWSLGCILYQMVYGRTPFSEYKTFWAKFKVITDPTHEIRYEPVSNPWLLDLMRKCLAWDRSKRWRIPQLLHHPFLVPPVPLELPPSLCCCNQTLNCRLVQLITEVAARDQQTSVLCYQLQTMLMDPMSVIPSNLTSSREQLHKLLSDISEACCQLQQELSDCS